jgi:nitroimidazol reductase NimA-like FMN-containing flavoprotein (pyridoxamine 5'-phosphate oxidase superfamily)
MTIEELEAIGAARMEDDEIRSFLSNQGTGVLGLPADDGPYLLPISFGYDGERRLAFTFVPAERSRKRELSDRATQATFLVYDATTMFSWQSVVCAGTIDEVTGDDLDAALETMRNAWHPDLLEQAKLSGDVVVYAFDVTEWSGVKHMGLPPGLEPAERD